ncbi:MAG: bifunctional UDP-4-keto-pentose/UDP-xylose synthase, partial [Synergistaceae bacterium]|nr:bifunctional UDP-4-keto-pentose/UDP-xylose synthase [Synergistaceae bacterium]
VFILGAGGFIGTHLTEKLLNAGCEVSAFDINTSRLERFIGNSRFTCYTGDIFTETEYIREQVRISDVVLPFAGVAMPLYYLTNPLWTFELDFEQNLKIVRMCVEYGKRVIFPSTSEVYGMSDGSLLDEETSPLVLGPVNKMRWIYSCSKQMIDRVITAYGQEKGLKYTLFRPFNWIGPGLDTMNDAREHRARSVTQIIYDILNRGEVKLVGGGEQRRSFTWIGDGTDALMLIIRNENGHADSRIFNIGNPNNNYSIRELTEIIIDEMKAFPSFREKAENAKLVIVTPESYYSNGYDDTKNRVPSINNIMSLGWKPSVSLREAVRMTLKAYHE